MFINHTEKFVFIHVPKIAGVSVSSVLPIQETCGRHSPAIVVRRCLGPLLKNYFCFAFVRNPWDRIYSWYLHATKPGGKQKYADEKKHITDLGFKKWLLDEETSKTVSAPNRKCPKRNWDGMRDALHTPYVVQKTPQMW